MQLACETKFDECRSAMEDPGLKIIKKEMQCLRCNEQSELDIGLRGETMRGGKTFKHHGSTLADDE